MRGSFGRVVEGVAIHSARRPQCATLIAGQPVLWRPRALTTRGALLFCMLSSPTGYRASVVTYELTPPPLCNPPHTSIRIHPGDVLAPFGRRHIEISVSRESLFEEIPRYILIEYNLLRLPMRQLTVGNLWPFKALACAPAFPPFGIFHQVGGKT